jgi:hypothetical protein
LRLSTQRRCAAPQSPASSSIAQRQKN